MDASNRMSEHLIKSIHPKVRSNYLFLGMLTVLANFELENALGFEVQS